ncbi:sulfur carrier protein ThiS [Aquimarina algicola]|nr:sulfur carrier protein ThiS [Aquimarina algicola]
MDQIFLRMTVNVNHQSQTIPDNCSIQHLLANLDIATNGIAIAINNHIITKEQWDTTLICDQDNITIIKATQGG